MQIIKKMKLPILTDKQKKYAKWGIALASIAIIGIGVWQYFKREVYLLQKYCYKVIGGKIHKFTESLFDFTINVKYQNNSNLTFEINRLDIEVSLMDKYAATVVINDTIQVPSGEPIIIPIRLQFSPTKFLQLEYVLKLVGYYLMNKKKVTIGIKGKASITKAISIKGFDFDFSTNLEEIMTPSEDDNTFDYCSEFK